MMLQKPRGTRDFLPDEMDARREVELRLRECARRWGYREVATPVFEELDLFTLRSGEGIIEEMYVFEDKGGRKMALRPEITAPVLRMYVNEARVWPKPLRWCYFADCFRYERPQKGRYRQFWQFGVELIGGDTPLADAEVIMLASELLDSTGISYTLQIGHLGFMRQLLAGIDAGVKCRIRQFLDKREFDELAAFLECEGHSKLWNKLTDLVDCRTLDEAWGICGDLPERERIMQTFALLDDTGIRYSLNPGIARGLDYYTGIVFEAFAENLGAENQILGGGGYRLAHLFGGDDVPSCGFALGFDRVMVARGTFSTRETHVVGIVHTKEGCGRALEVARAFRSAGIRTEIDLSDRSIGAQIAHASRTAGFAVIIGRRETESGLVTLKNLKSGIQREISLDEAIGEVITDGAC
jgi:histidyl-tRNA synthetase